MFHVQSKVSRLTNGTQRTRSIITSGNGMGNCLNSSAILSVLLIVVLILSFTSPDLIFSTFLLGFRARTHRVYTRSTRELYLAHLENSHEPLNSAEEIFTEEDFKSIDQISPPIDEILEPQEVEEKLEFLEDISIQEQEVKIVNSESDSSPTHRIVMVNIYLGKNEGEKFPGTDMLCVGLYTFIHTRSSHHMDVYIFHNHDKPLHCDIIPTWEGTGVRFIPITHTWFNEQAMKIGIDPEEYWGKKPTSICDFKPLYGHLAQDYITEYDFWAYGDIDGIFGHTKLFSPKLFEYDIISGYCNTNTEDEIPMRHQCQKGYASGPLTIVRNGKKTRAFLDNALDLWWIQYFKKRGKKYLDEQYIPPKSRKRNYRTFHKLLMNETHPPTETLSQYCTNSCEEIEKTNEMFVFNMSPDVTDKILMRFRWSRTEGVTIWYDNKDVYKAHFLHWSLWKYLEGGKSRKLLGKIVSQITNIDCFEFVSIPRGEFSLCED